MNKWIVIFIAFALLLSCNFTVAKTRPQLLDNANMVNDSEAIQAEINSIYQKYSTIVAIETLESLEGRDPDKFARDRFFELGLDREGVTVLNVYILYARKEKKIRTAHARNCGLDKGKMDGILKNLTQDLDRGSDTAFPNALKSLEYEIAGIIREGLTCPINQKDMGLYTDKTVFLVSDEDWRDVLGLVPVAVWSRNEEACQDIYAPGQGIKDHKCGYPLLIYHREGDSFDADSVMLFLEQYKAEKVLVVGDPPQDLANLLGVMVGKNNAYRLESGDHKRFWKSYKQAVVSGDDYKTAMLASVFASYLNAPLFIQDSGFNPGDVRDKELVCVGNVGGLECRDRFSLEELQKEYARLTGSEKIILVNPGDIGDEYCENERFGNVNKIYCHDSLAASYMAAAKDEVIIFSPGNRLDEIRPWFRRTINGLFTDYKNVRYLTTIAGHKAIDTGSAGENGYSLDRQLLDFEGGPEEEIAFGRIMGITVSDTSSYMMRSVFYERLYDIIYGDGKPGLTAIGHSFDINQGFLPALVSNISREYDAGCYVQEEEYAGGICRKNIKPSKEEYGHKAVILFMNRGGTDRWAYTLRYNEIPDLDLSLGIAQAGLTNSYAAAEDKHRLFGANFIRKGGIGYYGALSTAEMGDVFSENSLLGYIVVHYLIEEGESLGRIMKHATENMERELNKKTYILLGDPSLNPGLPRTDIGYYPGGERE